MSENAPMFADLDEAAGWYRAWLLSSALPLWWSAGADRIRGGYHEGLTLEGAPAPGPRRARVQARQAWVYANAGAVGWEGPWRQAAQHGLDILQARFQRGPGRFATLLTLEGTPYDDTPAIYEHAFALLAMAALHAADPAWAQLAGEADRTRAFLETLRHDRGGFREAGAHPFQANAHMHLLESALAWEEAGADGWAALSDEIVRLALSRFIDAERGFLREFFDADWARAAGDDGALVEPGHQFEWAWLLERWGTRRSDDAARAAARRLYAHGLAGVDSRRRVAVNALSDDFSVRDAHARLWPQTEWLKAALTFGDRPQALVAAGGLAQYLVTPAPGAWRDKMRPDGGFVDEPAPASSFYHVLGACQALLGAAGQGG